MPGFEAQKYSVMLAVNERMKRHFSQVEIETAVKVFFMSNVPPALPGGWDLLGEAEEAFHVDWSQDFLTQQEIVRVWAYAVETDEFEKAIRAHCLPGCNRLDDHDGRDSGACMKDGSVIWSHKDVRPTETGYKISDEAAAEALRESGTE